MPAPLQAALEQQQIAAVGVDVEQVGIQPADPQRRLSHAAPPPWTRRTRRSRRPAAEARRRRPAATPSATSSAASTRSSRMTSGSDDRRPSGVTISRSRWIAACSPSSTTASGREANTQPSISRMSATGGSSISESKESIASASAIATRPPGARCSRAQRRNPRATVGPEQLHRLHRHDDERKPAAEREVAARSRRPSRPAGHRRVRAARRASSGSRSSATTS